VLFDIFIHMTLLAFSTYNTIDLSYPIYLTDPKAYDELCKLANGKFKHMFL
jgi:hypothetical protein